MRLTELRLWLAVIADDPSDRAERVEPLPNLDCLMRQGDSLFDPVGSTVRLRRSRRGPGRDGRGTSGRRWSPRPAPRSAHWSASSERPSAAPRRRRCATAERGRDAPHRRMPRGGAERRPLRPAARASIASCARAARRAPRRAPGPPRRPAAPRAAIASCRGSTIRATSPTCSRRVASIWSSATRRGSARRTLPPATRRRLAGRYRWWRGGQRGVRTSARSRGRVRRARHGAGRAAAASSPCWCRPSSPRHSTAPPRGTRSRRPPP